MRDSNVFESEIGGNLRCRQISEIALLLLRVGDRERAWYLLDLMADEDNSKGESH